MTIMDFIKYQGLGNDFIVIDAREPLLPRDQIEGLTNKVIPLCDRRFGIGADGLILVLPSSERADVRMRIFNSDGSEPENCGNGIRCLSSFVFKRDNLSTSKDLLVETLAGIVSTSILSDKTIKVDMGVPSFEPYKIPTLLPVGRYDIPEDEITIDESKFKIYAAGMGNPHMVIKVEDLSIINLNSLGPALENHHSFPSKTNVHFVKVNNENDVEMLIWERGCGPTLACGTGACATHAVLHKLGFCSTNIRLKLPGGILSTTWHSYDQSIFMSGPAEEVFSGVIKLSQIG